MITLSINVYNQKGVLEKLSGLLRRKLFNIEYIHAEPIDDRSGVTNIVVKISGPNEYKADNLIKLIDKIVEVIETKIIDEKTN